MSLFIKLIELLLAAMYKIWNPYVLHFQKIEALISVTYKL